jgi:S-adenosylmethionine synthetase
VTEGHPDKIADQISDAVLDAVYTDDPMGRVAVETLVTTGLIIVGGEMTTSTYVDISALARQVIREIGYTRAKYGFDCDTCGVIVAIDPQSPDIAQGVDHALEEREGCHEDVEFDSIGAGDQGMMFGYACNETPELMPMPIALAHRLALRLSEVRKQNILPYLRPDGKTQVTVAYDGGRPTHIDTVVISAQHGPALDIEGAMKPDLIDQVITPILPPEMLDPMPRILVNPTGRFEIGGPMGDTGLTGRKIMVDTYCGIAPHGGGCFSGKDPTKVDRSAAYMARFAAKNIVANNLAKECLISVAYAIGRAEPLMIEAIDENRESLTNLVKENFDFRPKAIIERLNLLRPIYLETASYGHFGKSGLPWEEIISL